MDECTRQNEERISEMQAVNTNLRVKETSRVPVRPHPEHEDRVAEASQSHRTQEVKRGANPALLGWLVN